MKLEPAINTAIRTVYQTTNFVGPLHHKLAPATLAGAARHAEEFVPLAANRTQAMVAGMRSGALRSAASASLMGAKPFAIMDFVAGTHQERPFATMLPTRLSSVSGNIGVAGWGALAAQIMGVSIPLTTAIAVPTNVCFVAGACMGVLLVLTGTPIDVSFDHFCEISSMPFYRLQMQLLSLVSAAIKGVVLAVAASIGALHGLYAGVRYDLPAPMVENRTLACLNDSTLQSCVPLNEIENKYFLRLDSGYAFDAREFEQFNRNRQTWLNPYTMAALGATDVQRVQLHASGIGRQLLAGQQGKEAAAVRWSDVTVQLLQAVCAGLNHANPEEQKEELLGALAHHVDSLAPSERRDFDLAMTSSTGETWAAALGNLNPATGINGCANAVTAYFADRLRFVVNARCRAGLQEIAAPQFVLAVAA